MIAFLAQADAGALPLRDGSVDAIVCDPPYGLGFMGKSWDEPGSFVERRSVRSNRFDHVGGNHNPVDAADAARTRGVENRRAQEWHERWAHEALRVLKPGGHLLAFGGTRTWHRLACAIEDAGFEYRDTVMWLYGSGFPKSLNIGDGWGTALKPAWEPIIMARKPLVGTVAQNVAAHGTGALNIDGTRVGDGQDKGEWPITARDPTDRVATGARGATPTDHSLGRWPANLVLDEEAAARLDAQAPDAGAAGQASGPSLTEGWHGHTLAGPYRGTDEPAPFYGDTGGASRFFYCPKATRAEREAGLDDLALQRRTDSEARQDDAPGSNNPRLRTSARRNDHPTVKPVALMRWLVRLVTPPDGLVLDPFVGSGSTGIAALREGFRFIGGDLDRHYLDIAQRRTSGVVMAVQEPLL